jgi:hypothetical protein
MWGRQKRKAKKKIRINAEDTESAEDAEKRRNLVALDRKSPPIAKGAKGGAPSSFNGRRHNEMGKKQTPTGRLAFPGLLDLFF